MKSTVYDFTPPSIVGALGDTTMTPALAKATERALKRRGAEAVCLPFQVAPRYLKNVVDCMRLMDIVGLVVHPSHQRGIMKKLTHVDKGARDAGFVDAVIRKGKHFVGINAWARALREAARAGEKRSTVVTGANAAARTAARILGVTRIARATTKRMADLPKNALVIDLGDIPVIHRGITCITSADVEKLTAKTTIDILANIL